MKQQEGFLTSLDTAMFFFRVCRRYKVEKLEDRVLVMREIVRRKKATYLRDVGEYVEGKKVMVIKKETE